MSLVATVLSPISVKILYYSCIQAKIFLVLTYQAPPGADGSGSDSDSAEWDSGDSEDLSTEEEQEDRDGYRDRRGGRQRQELFNKTTYFQVRVHILEARKLVGSGLNPMVKVTCGKDVQETSSQKGTNNPVFDEVCITGTKITSLA